MTNEPRRVDSTRDWPSTRASDSLPQDPSATVDHPVSPSSKTDSAEKLLLQSGDHLADFQLVRELGKGSFARVFLARQLSLGRLVALKIFSAYNREAKTLANLEHPHVVQVFGEFVDLQWNLRLLCMRFVDGTTLHRVLRVLGESPFAQRSGRDLLEAIEKVNPPQEDDLPAEASSPLLHLDTIETTCWLGNRLADALAYAHRRGVQHRDVKPANVLLDRLGNPLLVDFNLAFEQGRAKRGSPGGTPAYMAPEHRAAFVGGGDADAIDGRADVYSLALVLLEYLAGKLPDDEERLAPRRVEPAIPGVLDRTLRCGLQEDPERRYQSATEFAAALHGCREWQQSQKELPPTYWVQSLASRHPRLFGVVLGALPHVGGAALVVCWNAAWLSAVPDAFRWTGLFVGLGLAYAILSILLTSLVAWWRGGSLWRTWRSTLQPEDDVVEEATMTARRAEALAVTNLVLLLSLVGWLPGTILIPLILGWFAGVEVGAHLAVSFCIGGLMAMTYCGYVGMFLTLRIGYSTMWCDAQRFWQIARKELSRLRVPLRILQVLTWLVPLLAGAVFLIGPSGEWIETAEPSGRRLFQRLTLSLIVLGMLSSALATLIHAYLQRTVSALTGRGHSD